MRKLLVCLTLLLTVCSGWSAVAYVDGQFAAGNGVTSLDVTTLTVSGSNTCIVAFLHLNPATSATSVNWDQDGTPQALTTRGSSSNGGYTEVFVKVAPTAGNKKLHAAWTTSSSAVLGVVAFSGTDQTTCIKTADTVLTSDLSTPATVTVTSSTDGATFAAESNIFGNINTTDTQTAVYRDNSTNVDAAGSYAIGNSSNAHTWSTTSPGLWSGVGVHVIAPASTTCKGALSMMGVGGC